MCSRGKEKTTFSGQKYTDGQKKCYSKILHVLHVAHKHELHKLTMTKILSQASVILVCRFCLPGMFANIHVTIFSHHKFYM